MKRSVGLCGVVVSLLLSASGGLASTNGFFTPFFRGTPSSEAGYWETFTVPIGAPGNLPDRTGATTGAALVQSDTNAVLTGSGNIYNLNAVSVFSISDATPFNLGTVVLQVRTLGSEVDYDSMILRYSDGAGEHLVSPLARVELNRGNQPGLGATVSSLWQWDLSGRDVSAYAIEFRAAAASLSLDSVTLDTWNQFIPLFTPPFAVNDTVPVIERWMYANNAAPCDRPAGSAFGTFGDEAGVDTRHAQHLLGWDLAAAIATNLGPTRYLVRRCRVTLTINRGNLFRFDPSHDAIATYFETNHPGYIPDADTGRPVELFGVGFRNGYDIASFDQCGLFGTNAPGQRSAYAAGYSTNGMLVDVSNNVGKTNSAYAPFEVRPFAIGQTTNVAPGELVPAGAKMTFELNLDDPFVLAYVQRGLDQGKLRLMVSALHTSGGQLGTPSYPEFATRFNEVVIAPTRLELEGVTVSSRDVDADTLADDWELYHLGSLTHNATNDLDADGSLNRAEFRAGTKPQDASSSLHITSISGGAGVVTIGAPHAANRRYVAEYSAGLNSWSLVTNAPTFDLFQGVVRWTHTPSDPAKTFYRVRLE